MFVVFTHGDGVYRAAAGPGCASGNLVDIPGPAKVNSIRNSNWW